MKTQVIRHIKRGDIEFDVTEWVETREERDDNTFYICVWSLPILLLTADWLFKMM